ncbi:alpha/beta fold hydrolase [Prauserella muralis]|uniref:Haloalkane dehalogenase n=1 Tax=Prauserella muralis TaxID=588067 RepID=A0A2V4AY79_9PSEU|nr:alpha/beta hydrolase [Prauserella muralis]PXY26951.1 haloalkane dehalogenase [Prauserella muralis]TWE23435.1 pimeloyl-ACP methyl ester carboxylesterase [Prauserella muralis]
MIEQLTIPTPAGAFDAIAAGPGDGRPVLLLHGFPEAGVQWEHQVAELGADGYRAVAPDQRGYSPAVRPEDPAEYGIAELVGDVLALADALGWSRFDLVGHDWGAAVGWWTAAEHAARLRTLTAVSTPHPAALAQAIRTDEDQAMRSAYLSEWRQTRATEKRMLANDAEALRRMFEWKVPRGHVEDYVLRLSEPGALTAALNWYRAGRPDGEAGPIEVPTLYVWGTEDVAFGSTAALGTENWVTGPYEFRMFEDVTHWLPEEVPEAFTAVLREFLATR